MSHVFLCDGGCGATAAAEKDFETLGIVIKRHYCKKCAKVVVKYLEDRDKIHEEAAEFFTAGLDALDAQVHEKHVAMRLPDG